VEITDLRPTRFYRRRGIENNRFESVLGHWWPDESPENVREMRALATQNSIEGETRLEMSFWHKLHIFLHSGR